MTRGREDELLNKPAFASGHQENGMVVFGIFVSGKGSLMSLSFENMSLGYLFLGWMSLALEGHL